MRIRSAGRRKPSGAAPFPVFRFQWEAVLNWEYRRHYHKNQGGAIENGKENYRVHQAAGACR